MIESPVWLKSRSREPEAKAVIQKLWQVPRTAEVSDPLLERGVDEPDADDREALPTLTVKDLLAAKEYRQTLLVAVFAMVMQQISGLRLPNSMDNLRDASWQESMLFFTTRTRF